MEWLSYLLVFLVVCVVYFFITRIWIGGIDLLIAGIKKILRVDRDDGKNWHTLDEIRDKNKKDSSSNTND